MDEDRLQRIENKLDDLQSAVVTLARIEERTTTIFQNHARLSERVTVVEQDNLDLSKKINGRFSERIFWLLAVALVGAYATYLLGG